jgi:hypothetical protein
LVDANGIKGMLGASEDSNKAFSSCSEKGAKEAEKAEERKQSDDKAKAIANAKAITLAAKNKLVGETIDLMKNI